MSSGVSRADRSGGPCGFATFARLAGASMVLMATLGWASHRGPLEAQAAPRDWSAWSTAIDEHVPGQKDSALVRIAPWSRNQLEAILPLLSRELERIEPVEQRRLIGRALVLHTDAAVLNRTSSGYKLPPTWNAVTLVTDGNVVGRMTGTFHWEFMRRMLGRLPASDDRRRISQIFFRATAAELQRWAETPELMLHLAAGRKLLGDDPVLLLYEGTTQQAYATPRIQQYFAERRERAQSADSPVPISPALPRTIPLIAPPPLTTTEVAPSIRGQRDQAQRTFRRALSLDPSLAEARIRLARVLGDDDRHEEAVTELTRALAGPLTPFLGYYAALLMGREQRALAQLDAAQASFERARAIYPDAAPPRYGLSEIALARGDVDRARTLLLNFAPPPGDVNLLWGRVDRLHDPSALVLLDQMRRAFSQ